MIKALKFLEDLHDPNKNFKCPRCGSERFPKKQTFNEFTDADGNRGKKVTYIECRDCGYEVAR